MLTLRGIITILVLAALFALAVVFISKNGGWKAAAAATVLPATATATTRNKKSNKKPFSCPPCTICTGGLNRF